MELYSGLGVRLLIFAAIYAFLLTYLVIYAKRIEKELEYPGQIRVNVIRETRSTEYAK